MNARDPLHRPTPIVFYNGEPQYMLNKYLFDSQDCWENIEAIVEAHELKLLLMDMISKEDSVPMLKSLAQDITEVEFELQSLWKFPKDIKFHRFWELPKCSCPKLDNSDSYPHRQYTRLDCPLHGGNE